MNNQLLYSLILTTVILTMTCETGKIADAANSDNAFITGKIFQSDGTTPASGVTVSLRPKNTLADFRTNAMNKKQSTDISVATGNTGVFAFDTFPGEGVFVIEAVLDNDILLFDSIVVDEKHEMHSLPPAAIKPAGAIRGKIKLSSGGAVTDVFVLAFGIDRFSSVESDSSFIFKNLGEGTYCLRFISSMDDYGTVDTADIHVSSSDTIDVGVVELPYLKIPIPQNVRTSYDTLHQNVTLTWDAPSTASVTGYAIFRKNTELFSPWDIEINSEPVIGTTYIDSCARQDSVYEYRVAAVAADGKMGLKSDPATVTIAPYLACDTVISLTAIDELCKCKSISDFATSPNGDIYIVSQEYDGVLVFDAGMHFKHKIGNGFWMQPQTSICIGKSGLLFVANAFPLEKRAFYWQNGETFRNPADGLTYISKPEILVYDEAGNIVDTIIDSCLNHISTITATEDMLYVLKCYYSTDTLVHDSISVFTSSGEKRNMWRCDGCWSITAGENNTLYAFNSTKSNVVIYDSQGTLITEICNAPTWWGIPDMTYNKVLKSLLIANGSAIYMTDSTANMIVGYSQAVYCHYPKISSELDGSILFITAGGIENNEPLNMYKYSLR